MSAGELLLGIDVGTSATKAVLCDRAGRVAGAGSGEHEISMPRAGWSEQDPEWWWRAACGAVQGALGAARARGEDVRAAGLSGQMHGSVLLPREAVTGDGSGARALRPALLWNDQRTAAQCAWIEERAGGRRALVEMVGNAALPGFTLPKLRWVMEEEPEVWRRVAAVLLPKDFVRLKMTGVCATDVGDAAGTLLFDVDGRAWSDEACDRFEIDPSILPPAYESAVVTGTVTAWAAREMGLREGTPVVAGSGDNQGGAVGAGVVEPGMVAVTLGTSGVIYAHAERPVRDLPGRLHTMCAATGSARGAGAWSITGCMLSAAGSLHWARETLFPGVSYGALMAEAAAVPPGSGGLVFLPYLTGERCPYADPMARGGWIGLTARHTRGHLVRAILEGVSFGMAQIMDLARSIGVRVERVRIGGGGAKSALWRQMQADLYGLPVAVTNTEEGPGYGAALLAGVGAGVWGSVAEACRACVREAEATLPGPGAALYGPAREVYGRLYGDLRDAVHTLARAEAAVPAPA